MRAIVDQPLVLFLILLAARWCGAYLGDCFRRNVRPLGTDEQEDFNTVLNATLTLLALIVGFSFSMAVNRYDQRKGYEEAEANAIGTEFLRADLLPREKTRKVRELLGRYLQQRIAFYLGDEEAGAESVKVQSELWSSVTDVAGTQPTPVVTLAVSGMNDVLNSQGYTQAAWWNRIPIPAWGLMALIAIFANTLLGHRERKTGVVVLSILPVIASSAFFLIADIDSPNGGVIHVQPQNLISVSEFMKAHDSN